MIPFEEPIIATVEPWMDKAKCKGQPTEQYDVDNLPSPLLGRGRVHQQAARSACRGCLVLPNCAWYAYRYKIVGYIMAGIPVKTQRNEAQFADLLAIAAGAGIEDARNKLSNGAA